eukprot:scaffold144725_cov34-Prasinocladus_malaysianus.AAC.1
MWALIALGRVNNKHVNAREKGSGPAHVIGVHPAEHMVEGGHQRPHSGGPGAKERLDQVQRGLDLLGRAQQGLQAEAEIPPGRPKGPTHPATPGPITEVAEVGPVGRVARVPGGLRGPRRRLPRGTV